MGASNRRIPPEEKARLQDQCRQLRGEGLLLNDIAARLSVSRSTVSTWLKEMGEPASGLSREQRARLQDQCRELRRGGLDQYAIAEALGVSQSTVSSWLLETEEPKPARVRRKAPREVPQIEPPVVAYRHSVTLILVTSIERELREVNAEHCFAGDVADARECADTAWLHDAGLALESLQAYLDRLHAVLGDEQVALGDADRRDDVAQIAQYRKRKGPRRNFDGRRWTDEETALVMRMDLPVARIAQMLGRSQSAVFNMRSRMRATE